MKQLVLILTCLIYACGTSSEPERPPSTLDNAWSEFDQKKYAEAIPLFQQSISENSQEIDAYVGLAYSFMFINDFFNSTLILNQGLQIDSDYPDLLAAFAFILNAEGADAATSNLFAAQLLSLAPNWSFTHGLNLDTTDVYLIQAQNYFLLGNFADCLATLQLIDSTFTADITTLEGITGLANAIESLNVGL